MTEEIKEEIKEESKIEMSKQFSELLIIKQMERAERHEKRTWHMFWMMAVLFGLFMLLAYCNPMTVDQSVQDDDKMVKQVSKG